MRERVRIAQRDEDHAVVRERRHGRQRRALLPAAGAGAGNKDAGILARVAAGGPNLARLVPERLPLGGEVAVARRDADQVAVVLQQLGRVVEHGHGGGLGRGVHLGEHVVGEGFGYPGGR